MDVLLWYNGIIMCIGEQLCIEWDTNDSRIDDMQKIKVKQRKQMIKNITLSNVASYKNRTVLETDNKVNLIYGLNGVGKTILSNYLATLNIDKIDDPLSDKELNKFKDCRVEGFDANTQKILVYNEKFIDDVFYKNDKQKGVFTLAKENKQAFENIKKAENKKGELEANLKDREEAKQKKEDVLNNRRSAIQERIWQKISTNDKTNDNFFHNQGCFQGKGTKERLFNHLIKIELSEPSKTIEQLRNEWKELGGDNIEKREKYNPIVNNILQIENDVIFTEIIVGTKDSPIAHLITELNNSDWVKKGLEFVNLDERNTCPFCQQETLKEELVNDIKNYFDETYQNKIQKLKRFKTEYENLNINKEGYDKKYFTEDVKSEITQLIDGFNAKRTHNLQQIEKKISNPSQIIELQSTQSIIDQINKFIEKINKLNNDFNEKLDNQAETIEKYKDYFWIIQRAEYNGDIQEYKKDIKQLNKDIKNIDTEITGINNNIRAQEEIISTNQAHTTNIDKSISEINKRLEYFGLESIAIEKTEEQWYKIVREGDEEEGVYKSLSEGEKTIITFLYFLELCINKESESDRKEKIVVIDDPVSSLSHIYTFDVSRLIKTYLIDQSSSDLITDCIQCFILTHNLHFFCQLAYRKNFQLFRIYIENKASNITHLKYNDIQSDYQAHWEIIKQDKENNKRIVANAMRNIIEYFFGFVENKELNNIFRNEQLKKYKFFCDYIQNSSHSKLTTVYDYSQVDNNKWRKAFKALFREAGYEEHYKEMMRKGRNT